MDNLIDWLSTILDEDLHAAYERNDRTAASDIGVKELFVKKLINALDHTPDDEYARGKAAAYTEVVQAIAFTYRHRPGWKQEWEA